MISIVYITCNRQYELIDSINSCLQFIHEEFELIVIDNNSTDDTEKMVRNIAFRLDIKLIYIKNDLNFGVAKSRNQGYENSNGDIVFFLDDDAVIKQETKMNIDDVASYMRKNYKYPIISNEIYNVTEKYYQHGCFDKKSNLNKEGKVFYFIGASHFLNKKVLGNIKLYPDEFKYGGEELYLSYTIIKQGFELRYLPFFQVLHKPSMNQRMDPMSTKIKNYSNAFNVKRYFTPFCFMPLIHTIMVLRVLLNSRFNPKIIKLFLKQINSTYNSKYDNKYSIKKFISLLIDFEIKSVL